MSKQIKVRQVQLALTEATLQQLYIEKHWDDTLNAETVLESLRMKADYKLAKYIEQQMNKAFCEFKL